MVLSWQLKSCLPVTKQRIWLTTRRRATGEFIPWLGLPAAALELEASVTMGKFSTAACLNDGVRLGT
jgi:hypothetical protein